MKRNKPNLEELAATCRTLYYCMTCRVREEVTGKLPNINRKHRCGAIMRVMSTNTVSDPS